MDDGEHPHDDPRDKRIGNRPCQPGSGAWLAWTIAYALVAGIVMGVLTVVHGQEVIAGEMLLGLPAWLHPALLLAALVSLVWEAVDERKNRFHPVSDRAVIGWHILGDILLLPARLTFGIGHQLAAFIRLNRSEEDEAFRLLGHIYVEKRCPSHSLGAWFPNQKRLRKILVALQLAGWTDLLRTEAGWIYIVRSTEAAELDAMFSGGEKASEPLPGEE
ncbi:MAG: hypothetical protein WCS31_10565 [Verrucomicrobiae bacterium]